MNKILLRTTVLLILSLLAACDGKKGSHQPVYVSKAVLLFEYTELRLNNPSESPSQDILESIVESIRSRIILRRTVESLSLQDNPEFMGKKEDGTPWSKEEAFEKLSKYIQISIRPKTRLMDIIAEHTNPEMARILTEAVEKECIRFAFEQCLVSDRLANQRLLEDASKLRAKIKESENRRQEYHGNTHADLNEYNAITKEEEANVAAYQLLLTRVKDIEASPPGPGPRCPVKRVEEATTPIRK